MEKIVHKLEDLIPVIGPIKDYMRNKKIYNSNGENLTELQVGEIGLKIGFHLLYHASLIKIAYTLLEKTH